MQPSSDGGPVVYVVRFATRITGHRVLRSKWDASPAPRAFCGLRLDLDVFEKAGPGACGETECAKCAVHPLPDQALCPARSPRGSPCGRAKGHTPRHQAFSPRSGDLREQWADGDEDSRLFRLERDA